MKMEKIVVNFIITIVLILCIFMYKISFTKNNFQKLTKNNTPKYEKEYKEIKNTYDLLKENYTFTPAEIINLSIKKLNNLIIINKGSNDGIKELSFVVNNDGLVGETIKVFKDFSIVRLIYSNKTNIAVEINECFGTLRVKNNKYYINDLINCSNVEKNDAVFTSKYNYSSSNIPVGTVKKIEKDKIYITFNTNPYKIRYLGVINDNNWYIFKYI